MDRPRCILACPNFSHDPIDLNHGETVTVGRSAFTRITDPQVSRNQVELVADCDNLKVTVKATGSHPCEVEGKQLSKGETALLRDKGLLRLLPGKFEKVIQFLSDKKILDSRCVDEEMPKSKVESSGSRKSKQTKGTVSSGKPAEEEEVDSDSEQMENIAKRLKLMQENVKLDTEREKKDETKPEVPNSSSSVETKGKGQLALTCGSPSLNSVWEEHGLLLMFTSKGVIPSSKIAAYDIDGTVITTKSGRTFPTNYGDWQILFPEIPGKLKQLHSAGFKIVFISNQMGFQKGKVKPKEFKGKIESILEKLNIPVQVFIATGSGEYRKPAPGMWNHLAEQANGGITVDLNSSFYVGDAAGRPKDWTAGKKKDFSCSDRLFAINIGVKFYTPEEHFLGQKPAKFEMPAFDPRKIKNDVSLLSPTDAKLVMGKQEVIVLVGSPASGKSHFTRKHLIPNGYVHVNRDVLKTWQKCVQATHDALESNKSVVVDNTNPDKESRKRYIDVAKVAGVPCRCFVMTASFEQAHHNEKFREMTDKSHDSISDMVFNFFKSKYQEPTTAEGFEEIVKVNFIPEFLSSEQKCLYQKFLVEK